MLKDQLLKFLFDIIPDWITFMINKYNEFKGIAIAGVETVRNTMESLYNDYTPIIKRCTDKILAKFLNFTTEQKNIFNNTVKKLIAFDCANVDTYDGLSKLNEFFQFKDLLKVDTYSQITVDEPNEWNLQNYFNTTASNWGIQINFSMDLSMFGFPQGSIGLSLGIGMTCMPVNIEAGTIDWDHGLYQFGDSNSVSPGVGVSMEGGGSQKTGDPDAGPFSFSVGIWWTYGTLGVGVDSLCGGFGFSVPSGLESVEAIVAPDWTWGAPEDPKGFARIGQPGYNAQCKTSTRYTENCPEGMIPCNDNNTTCCYNTNGKGNGSTKSFSDQICTSARERDTAYGLANNIDIIYDKSDVRKTNYQKEQEEYNCESKSPEWPPSRYKIVPFIDENPMPALMVAVGKGTGGAASLSFPIVAFHGFVHIFPSIWSGVLPWRNTSYYSVGDKVYWNDKVYKAVAMSKGVEPLKGGSTIWEVSTV